MTYPNADRFAAGAHRRLLVACAALAIGLTATSTASRAHAQVTDFNVTSSGTAAYLINGQPNPTLNLQRGSTYRFIVNASGHPFYIKTAQGTGTGNAYNLGVSNNGTDSGTIVFTVPGTAPATLFYQCSNHAPMTGTIAITGSVPAPALPPWAWLPLLASLLAVGVVATRQRALTT